MREVKIKNLSFEIKQVEESGQFEGMAAVYGIRDELGDVIEKGAFTRSLEHHKGKFPLFWQHRLDEPMGFVDVQDSETGLRVKGKLNLEVARARETHALMKQAAAEGVPFGLSFGFDTIQATWQGGVRHLKEIRLYEISPTLVPAHPMAQVISVKQTEGKPFGEFEDMDACIAANQDKEDPEGFCAWLHQQITGQWPGERASWEPRIAALFARTPEVKLSREVVAKLCPSCGDEMAKRRMTVLRLSPKTVKQMPEQLLQGLCDKYGGDEGFFTRCVDDPPSEIDDPESFCAWLHEQCIGSFPGEGRSRVAGVRFALSEIGKTLDAIPSVAGGLAEAIQRIREAKDALTALLETNSDLALVRDPAELAFRRLMVEMRQEAARRLTPA